MTSSSSAYSSSSDSSSSDGENSARGSLYATSSGSDAESKSRNTIKTDTRASVLRSTKSSSKTVTRMKKEMNSGDTMMALGTKKRDRRTIEEIQRDLKKNRPPSRPSSRPSSRPTSPGFTRSGTNSPPGSAPGTPRRSPALSPMASDSSGDEGGSKKSTILPSSSFKLPNAISSTSKNSARSRLAKKVLGRKRKGAQTSKQAAKTKEVSSKPNSVPPATKSGSSFNSVPSLSIRNKSIGEVVTTSQTGNGSAPIQSPPAWSPADDDDDYSESSDSSDSSSADGSSGSGDSSSSAFGEDSRKDHNLSSRSLRDTASSKQRVNYAEESSESETAEVIVTQQLLAVESILQSRKIKRLSCHELPSHHGKVRQSASSQTCTACQNEPADRSFDVKEMTEYLIKWQGKSHLHNTWEVEVTLKGSSFGSGEDAVAIRPAKQKLENFKRKQNEIQELRKISTPEEIEAWELKQSSLQELWEQYVLVDRVIASRVDENGTQNYLCKWVGLPYAEATWEFPADILPAGQDEVNEFNKRESKERSTETEPLSLDGRRAVFESMDCKKQPEFLPADIKLFDYQIAGVEWLLRAWSQGRNGILADEMGLGKTLQAISFAAITRQADSLGPTLIVVPLSTLQQWAKEFQRFAPHLNAVVYIGNAQSRQMVREYEWRYNGDSDSPNGFKIDVLLTTYEMILADASFLSDVHWGHLFVDEAHRLKNHKSELYVALQEFHTETRLLITGTPLQNSLHELWCLLHFIDSEKFPASEDFDELDKFFSHQQTSTSNNASDDSNQSIIERTCTIEKLLEPHLLRRIKQNVDMGLPPKTHLILPVPLSKMQREYYRYVLSRNFVELNKHVKKGQGERQNSLLNIVMELKKACNHPFLFEGARIKAKTQMTASGNPQQGLLKHSGKMVVLDKLLQRLRKENHRVLIFSQMVRVLDLLAEYCTFRGLAYQRLDGSTTRSTRDQAIAHFNAPGSEDFVFLLSTRAGGLGINLTTADTVILFDIDWNPQNDLQAEARCHRVGQKKPVVVYRLISTGTVEEQILERNKEKLVLDHLVIQSKQNKMSQDGKARSADVSTGAGGNGKSQSHLNRVLRFGAKELFSEESANENSADELLNNLDIDAVLEQAEKDRSAAAATSTTDTSTQSTKPTSAFDALLNSFKMAKLQTLKDNAQSDETKDSENQPEDEGFWENIIPKAEQDKAIKESEKADNVAIESIALTKSTLLTTNRSRRRPLSYAEEASDVDESEESSDETEVPASGRNKAGKPRKRKRAEKQEQRKRKPKIALEKVARAVVRSIMRYANYQDLKQARAGASMVPLFVQKCGLLKSGSAGSEIQLLLEERVGKKPEATSTLASYGIQLFETIEKAVVDGVRGGQKLESTLVKIEGKEYRAFHAMERVYFNSKIIQALEKAASGKGVASSSIENFCSASDGKLSLKLEDLGIRDMIPWTWAEREYTWSSERDIALLFGVYIHGFGGWEDILNDPKLGFETKVFASAKRERFRKRAEALIRKLPDLPNMVCPGSLSSDLMKHLSHERVETASSRKPGQGRLQRAAERAARRSAAKGGAKSKGEFVRSNTSSVNAKSSKISAKAASSEEEGQVSGEDKEKHNTREDKKYKRQSSLESDTRKEAKDAKTIKALESLDSKLRPKKVLRDVKQTLKKIKCISKWAAGRSENTIAEKILKYVVQVGEAVHVAIDNSVKQVDDLEAYETLLWDYIAEYTPLEGTHLQQLYSDLCHDSQYCAENKDRLGDEAMVKDSPKRVLEAEPVVEQPIAKKPKTTDNPSGGLLDLPRDANGVVKKPRYDRDRHYSRSSGDRRYNSGNRGGGGYNRRDDYYRSGNQSSTYRSRGYYR